MNRSETIGKLATALAKAQGEMDNASKDASNPAFKRNDNPLSGKYADLAAVRAAIQGPFSTNGLSYVQLPRFNVETGFVEVETMLMHGESGEWISESLSIPVGARTAHAVGGAITYGRRFGLMAISGLAAEDDDGNAASDKPQTTSQRAAPKPPPPKADPTPIADEIPHLYPNPAQQAAAEAKAVTDKARQDAGATAAVAKMKAGAAAPVSTSDSTTISKTLIKRCADANKGLLDAKRPRKLTDVINEHEWWKEDARKLWPDLTSLDRRLVDAERMKLEATIKAMAEAEAHAAMADGEAGDLAEQ